MNLDVNKLPSSTSIIYGPIKETIFKYLESLNKISNKKISYKIFQIQKSFKYIYSLFNNFNFYNIHKNK